LFDKFRYYGVKLEKIRRSERNQKISREKLKIFQSILIFPVN